MSLILSIGLHWYALQLLAWANMIRLDVPEKGLSTAIVTVLNGSEPCEICQAIRSVRFEDDSRKDKPAPTVDIRISKIDKDAPRIIPLVLTSDFLRLPVPVEPHHAIQAFAADIPVPPPEFS